MPRTLACRVGRHKWSTKVEQGETYTVCAGCGKERRGRWGDPPGTGPGGPGAPGDRWRRRRRLGVSRRGFFLGRLLNSHKWVRLQGLSEEGYRCRRCGKRRHGKLGDGPDFGAFTGGSGGSALDGPVMAFL